MRWLLAMLLACALPAWGQSCTTTVNSCATLQSACAANTSTAKNVCLQAGAYGNCTLSTNRTAVCNVILVNGASVSITPRLTGNFTTLDGSNGTLTWSDARIGVDNGGNPVCTNNVTFKNAAVVPGQTGLFIGGWSCSAGTHQDIVVDNINFTGSGRSSDGDDGMLEIRGGKYVTVKNSTFSGNAGDGVHTKDTSNNVTIGPGNYFNAVTQSGCPVHCDAIQNFAEMTNLEVVGNFFNANDSVATLHSISQTGMWWHNNVVVGGGAPCALQIGWLTVNFTFEHNTHYGCGAANTNALDGTTTSGVVRNNVFYSGGMDNVSGNCTACIYSYNVYYNSGSCIGTNCLTTQPTFLGGAPPFTKANWANWECTGGSCNNNGSDSLDRGTLYYGSAGSVPSTPTGFRIVELWLRNLFFR